jgi:uroporphyrinogen-III synthase
MTRALVTRPAEDAAEITKALEARGISVLAEPLLTIKAKEGVAIDTAGVQALLFTSANGARAFASSSPVRDLPAFAVGDATAETLRTRGFAKVESAKGDVEELEKLVRRRLDPTRGKLLHAAGSAVAGDLAGRLAQAGFTVDRVPLYDAEPAERLSDIARAEIAAGRIDWVVVFSPRTAAGFASVIERAGLEDAARKMTLVALSDAVAKAAKLAFRHVAVAADPTQAALLRTIDELMATKAPMTESKPAPLPPQSRVPLYLAAAALVVAVIAGALAITPRSPATSAPTVDLSPLMQRLDSIETTIAGLGRRLDGVAAEASQAGAKADAAASRPSEAAPAAPPVDLRPLEARLAGLERSLADVARRAASIAEAERRLAEVEKAAKAERSVDAAAVTALRLGEALASGRPYKAELALLSSTPGIEAEIRTLQTRAETGIPSRAALLERFPAAAAAAARNADRGDDAWSQMMAKARGLVQVRRMTPGEDLDGRLAQAELALKGGDLGRALAATEKLPEGATQALAAWRADARARYDAERALERISQTLAASAARSG